MGRNRARDSETDWSDSGLSQDKSYLTPDS